MRGLLITLALCAPLSAQEARYLSSGEVRAEFEALAGEYPGQVAIKPLPGGNPGLYAVWLGQGASGSVMLVLGSLRADELAPALACLELSRELLKGGKPAGRVVIIPTPCGSAMNGPFATPPTCQPGLHHPLDDDRDGATDEDGPGDIDGDGAITQMRVRRDGGRYRVSALDPRVLVKCKPGEPGGQYDLLWEGIDDDGDGTINEDPKGTVRLGNDFAIRWSDKQLGANRFPMLTAESGAIADFLLENPRICAALQLRSVGGKLVCAGGPPSGQAQPRARRAAAPAGEDVLARDKQLYESWQKRMDGLLPGRDAPAPEPEGAGNVLDWLYESAGIYAASWHMFRLPQEKEEKKERNEGKAAPEKRSPEEQAEINWLKYTPEDWREWKPFKHPQLGDVEIGGWAITARKDPKPADVAGLMEQVTLQVNAMLMQMPRLAIDAVEKKALGEGLHRIRVTLANPGDIDYKPAFAAHNRIGLPVFVGLEESADVELVSGTRRQRAENVISGATVTFEWVVRVKDAAKELKFKVEAQRTGDFTVSRALNDCTEWKE